MMKYCKKCEKETERYARGQCRPCNSRWSIAWRKANPEKVKAQSARDRAHYRAKNKDRDPHNGTDKRCSMCREVFPRTQVMWHTNPASFDGLKSGCGDCQTVSTLKNYAKKRGQILDLPDPCTGKELRALMKRQKNR